MPADLEPVSPGVVREGVARGVEAVCLVFDGGVQHPDILDAVVREEREIRGVSFCTPAQVRAGCSDHTARRVEAAMAQVAVGAAACAESGRVAPGTGGP